MNLVERTKGLMLGVGAEWVMWLLLGLSVISVAIMIERGLVLARANGDIGQMRQRLAAALFEGRMEDARSVLQVSRHPAAQVALRGLERARLDLPASQIEQAMKAEALAQKAHLERHLSFLGTLGSNAPFVGLFGTVIGIVAAFEHLGKGGAAAAGASSTELVMGAIAEALVSTAVGIGVAIPAILGFNQLLRMAKERIQSADLLAREVMASLPDVKKGDA
jgi:biopolymer transport protein ExbB